jgi:ABC-type multidrug transport system ATPase subunit
VLILDEPTIGLDPLQVLHTRELLAGMARDRVILLSTHLLAEAEALCGRALILVNGRLRSDVRLANLRQAAAFEIEVHGPVAAVEQALQRVPQVRSVVCLTVADAASVRDHRKPPAAERTSGHIQAASTTGLQNGNGPVDGDGQSRRAGSPSHDGYGRFWVECAPGIDLREEVAGTCYRAGWAVRELHSTARSLEDHFVRVALLPEREAA